MEITTTHDYYFEKTISKTLYSTVYKAYDESSERYVCIKEIDVSVLGSDIDKNIKKIKTEISCLKSLSDKTVHIPYFIESYFDKKNNKYYIIMQYVEGETLREKFNKRATFVEKEFLEIIIQLCKILEVMHKENYQHKDIKPENIIINRFGEVIVFDFNISVSNPNLIEGTYNYRAPEMSVEDLSGNRMGVDVFAIGTIMYEYYTTVSPAQNKTYFVDNKGYKSYLNPNEIIENINKRKSDGCKLPSVKKDIENIIVKCMDFCPQKRYSAKQLGFEINKLFRR